VGGRGEKGSIHHFSDLIAYRKAFAVGVAIFRISSAWPAEERYALTDQVRRSSRSIGANIAEAWAKRRYEAHFVSKLTDADAEAHETEHWLACALKHGYIDHADFDTMRSRLAEIGRLLGGMMANAETFRPRSVRGSIARP
jgi:four helix bundle protein